VRIDSAIPKQLGHDAAWFLSKRPRPRFKEDASQSGEVLGLAFAALRSEPLPDRLAELA
jgi:hypothetical protein